MTPRREKGEGTLESLRCHLSPLAVAAYPSSGISNLHPTCSCPGIQPHFNMSRQCQECLSRTTDDVATRSYSVAIESLSNPNIIISPQHIPFTMSYYRIIDCSILATSLEVISTKQFVQACCFRNRLGSRNFCSTVAHCREERNNSVAIATEHS